MPCLFYVNLLPLEVIFSCELRLSGCENAELTIIAHYFDFLYAMELK